MKHHLLLLSRLYGAVDDLFPDIETAALDDSEYQSEWCIIPFIFTHDIANDRWAPV